MIADLYPPRPKHIYISGPMRGRDGFNFPAFFAAEELLAGLFPGAEFFNPAQEDIDSIKSVATWHEVMDLLIADPSGLTAGRYLAEAGGEFDLRGALARDMKFICEKCDMIVLLDGWENSKGAVAEKALCEALGVRVAYQDGAKVSEVPGGGSVRQAVPSDHRITLDEFFLSDAHRREAARRSREEREDWLADVLLRKGPAEPDGSVLFHEGGSVFEGEVRATSSTGGQKGTKLAAFDQISPEIERMVAEHFGKGGLKYEPHNFRRGYPWSYSYAALRRHLAAFWDPTADPYDNHLPDCPEGCLDHTGSLHIVAVIWHAMALTEFFLHRQEFDDRYVYTDHE